MLSNKNASTIIDVVVIFMTIVVVISLSCGNLLYMEISQDADSVEDY